MTNSEQRATSKTTVRRSDGKWVAPSKGGYSGTPRSGATVSRPATPPTNPASGSAVRHGR